MSGENKNLSLDFFEKIEKFQIFLTYNTSLYFDHQITDDMPLLTYLVYL